MQHFPGGPTLKATIFWDIVFIMAPGHALIPPAMENQVFPTHIILILPGPNDAG
jgi:hypothetical protein